jgi:RNA polymerase sigma factor (sigma-70 family)
VQTPNDLTAAYNEYREHLNDETIAVLCSRIRSYARRMARTYKIHDPDDAADSILALAWASLSKFKGEASFATWLHTLTRRRLLNIVRADRSRPIIQVDARVERESPAADAPLLDVRTLTHLSEDEQHLIQSLIETQDYDRLAERLCISRKAVCRRLERIFKKCEAKREKLVANRA